MIYIRIASPPIIQTPHFNLQVESLLCCLMCVLYMCMYLVQALFYLPWDIWPTSSSMNSCDRSTVTKYQNYFTNPNNTHFQQILTMYDDVVCFFWSQKTQRSLFEHLLRSHEKIMMIYIFSGPIKIYWHFQLCSIYKSVTCFHS